MPFSNYGAAQHCTTISSIVNTRKCWWREENSIKKYEREQKCRTWKYLKSWKIKVECLALLHFNQVPTPKRFHFLKIAAMISLPHALYIFSILIKYIIYRVSVCLFVYKQVCFTWPKTFLEFWSSRDTGSCRFEESSFYFGASHRITHISCVYIFKGKRLNEWRQLKVRRHLISSALLTCTMCSAEEGINTTH